MLLRNQIRDITSLCSPALGVQEIHNKISSNHFIYRMTFLWVSFYLLICQSPSKNLKLLLHTLLLFEVYLNNCIQIKKKKRPRVLPYNEHQNHICLFSLIILSYLCEMCAFSDRRNEMENSIGQKLHLRLHYYFYDPDTVLSPERDSCNTWFQTLKVTEGSDLRSGPCIPYGDRGNKLNGSIGHSIGLWTSDYWNLQASLYLVNSLF